MEKLKNRCEQRTVSNQYPSPCGEGCGDTLSVRIFFKDSSIVRQKAPRFALRATRRAKIAAPKCGGTEAGMLHQLDAPSCASAGQSGNREVTTQCNRSAGAGPRADRRLSSARCCAIVTASENRSGPANSGASLMSN